MFHGGAEHDRAFIPNILQPSINDQPISFRNIDFALQIADVVLHAVESHLGQINIGMDADAADRYQFSNFYSGPDIEFVGSIFENVENDFVIICALRCGSQAESERWLEIGQNLLVCIRRGMMRFIDNEIVKTVILELLQVQSTLWTLPHTT